MEALPSANVLVNITDTFLESFFGPDMALHVRSFEGNKTTDDFMVDLHHCFGRWAKKMGNLFVVFGFHFAHANTPNQSQIERKRDEDNSGSKAGLQAY